MRVLIIGIGTSGKEILNRLNKIIKEKNKEIPKWIKTLSFDTDFQQDYQDQIRLGVNNLSDFYNKNKDEINQWLPSEVNKGDISDINRGAGQKRAVGRLALMYSKNQVNNALSEAFNQLQSPTVTGEFGNSEIYVFLVGSLCGGTGSGIFIDIGTQCKKINSECSLNGIFILPTFFIGKPNTEYVEENAIGALNELEHLSELPATCEDFKNLWESEIAQNFFNRVFLVENEYVNEEGETYTISNDDGGDSFYSAIALWLYLFSFTEAGSKALSIDNNYHGRKYYPSIGCGEIFIDSEKLKEVISINFLYEALSRLINQPPSDENKEKIFPEIIKEIASNDFRSLYPRIQLPRIEDDERSKIINEPLYRQNKLQETLAQLEKNQNNFDQLLRQTKEQLSSKINKTLKEEGLIESIKKANYLIDSLNRLANEDGTINKRIKECNEQINEHQRVIDSESNNLLSGLRFFKTNSTGKKIIKIFGYHLNSHIELEKYKRAKRLCEELKEDLEKKLEKIEKLNKKLESYLNCLQTQLVNLKLRQIGNQVRLEFTEALERPILNNIQDDWTNSINEKIIEYLQNPEPETKEELKDCLDKILEEVKKKIAKELSSLNILSLILANNEFKNSFLNKIKTLKTVSQPLLNLRKLGNNPERGTFWIIPTKDLENAFRKIVNGNFEICQGNEKDNFSIYLFNWQNPVELDQLKNFSDWQKQYYEHESPRLFHIDKNIYRHFINRKLKDVHLWALAASDSSDFKIVQFKSGSEQYEVQTKIDEKEINLVLGNARQIAMKKFLENTELINAMKKELDKTDKVKIIDNVNKVLNEIREKIEILSENERKNQGHFDLDTYECFMNEENALNSYLEEISTC